MIGEKNFIIASVQQIQLCKLSRTHKNEFRPNKPSMEFLRQGIEPHNL